MASQQVLQLWKSQLPHYQRIISRCVRSLTTPLTRFLPPDFQQRIQGFKQILDIKEIENYQNYLDIIVHFIEGIKNKSNIQLADLLVRELGGSLQFWQNVILDVAENINYAGQLTIWHIRKVFEDRLYIDAENLSNFRKMSKICKNYLVALKNLVRYINRYDKKRDSIAKIDDLFKKVKDAQSKYIQFIQLTKICEPSGTMDDVSNNVSQWSRQNAIKNLFNFPKMKKNLNEKSKNTLFNYNFKKNTQNKPQQTASQPTVNFKLTNLLIKGQKLKNFQQYIKEIKEYKQSIEDLKQQFSQFKVKKQSVPYNNYYVRICDREWYYNYTNFCMETQFNLQKSFQNPCQQITGVNYQIDDEEYLNEVAGEDVDENSEVSFFSEMSVQSFIVSDGHMSDDLDIDSPKNKPNYQYKFGDKWQFGGSNKQITSRFSDYQIIFLQQPKKFPLQMRPNQLDCHQLQILKIVDGNDKKTIIETLNKKQIKVSKNKLDGIIKKHCSKFKTNDSNSKFIYKIKEQLQNSVLQNITKNQIDQSKSNRSYSRKSKSKSHKNQTAQIFQIQYNSQNNPAKILELKKPSFPDQQITAEQDQTLRRSSRIQTKRSKSSRG